MLAASTVVAAAPVGGGGGGGDPPADAADAGRTPKRDVRGFFAVGWSKAAGSTAGWAAAGIALGDRSAADRLVGAAAPWSAIAA